MSSFRRSNPVEVSIGAANGTVYVYVPYLPGVPDKLKSIGARFTKYAIIYSSDGKRNPDLPGRPAWTLPKNVASIEKKTLNTIPNFPSEQLEIALKYLENETLTSTTPAPEKKRAISLDDIDTDSEDESGTKVPSTTNSTQAVVSILGSKVRINVKPSTPLECYDTPYGPMVKVNGSWKLLTYGAAPHTVTLG